MSETKYICDRCRGVILEDRTALKIESGLVRRSGLTGCDLCQDCSERFADFLKTRPETSPAQLVANV